MGADPGWTLIVQLHWTLYILGYWDDILGHVMRRGVTESGGIIIVSLSVTYASHNLVTVARICIRFNYNHMVI